jgi:surface carbohydrate biosynthesis protein
LNVYLPVETIAREFLSKLWLGNELALAGFNVFIGSKNQIAIEMANNEPGIYLEKSLQPGKLRRLASIRGAGHKIFTLCEEGLMFLNAHDYASRKLGIGEVEIVEKYFCWGQRHYETVKTICANGATDIQITGNPRMALCAKNVYSKIHYHRRKGSFVLINTKFARSNYVGIDRKNEREWLENQIKKGYVASQSQLELMERSVFQERRVLEFFVAFIREYPERGLALPLVVRPHPAEDFDFWQRICNGLPNVTLEHVGDSAHAISNARVVISNNCTSSVEAVLLGIPSINFRPFTDDAVEYILPRNLGMQIKNLEGLYAVLDNLSIYSPIENGELLHEYILNDYDNYVGSLVRHFLDVRNERSFGEARLGTVPSIFYRIRAKFRWLSRILPFRDKKSAVRSGQKFPGFSQGAIDEQLSALLESGLVSQRASVTLRNRELVVIS